MTTGEAVKILGTVRTVTIQMGRYGPISFGVTVLDHRREFSKDRWLVAPLEPGSGQYWTEGVNLSTEETI
jgi:hypothetical protein